MITVHHLEHSRSHRVLFLLEELGVPYRIERYARHPQTMLAPPELKKVHPLGKSPVIVDDDATVVAESAVILDYLIDRHGADGTLRPPAGTPGRLRYAYWMHYAEGSAMPPLLMSLLFTRVRRAPMPFFVKPVAKGIADKVMRQFVEPQLATHFDWIEAELGRHAWFAGDAFTAADIQMSYPVAAGVQRGRLDRDRPNLARWLAAVRARPAWQRAEAQGGPAIPPG